MRFLFLFVSAACLYAQSTLMIAHKWADSVGYYDAKTGKSLTTVPVGVRPHEMVFSQDRKLVYVTNYGLNSWTQTEPGGNTISIIDVAARRVVGTIDLGENHRPHGIELGRSGKLYITADQPPSVLVVDPVKKAVLKRVDVGAKAPHMLAVTKDEKLAYVANAGSGSVSMVHLDGTGAPVVIETGGVPMGIELTHDGQLCYLSARDSNQIVVIDTKSNKVDHRIEVKGQPARLRLIRNDTMLITSLIGSGEMAIVDLAARKEVQRIKTGTASEGLYVTPSGQYMYISAQGDNKVLKIDMKSWKTVLEIPTAQRPDPILEF
ncbi:MAG: hypothetical protein H7Y20_01710 [Bryobacteraceae bacterium]|nr:hypothetical protein [Bryobacteraceae bacterium]